jgi:hypothetical protein
MFHAFGSAGSKAISRKAGDFLQKEYVPMLMAGRAPGIDFRVKRGGFEKRALAMPFALWQKPRAPTERLVVRPGLQLR